MNWLLETIKNLLLFLSDLSCLPFLFSSFASAILKIERTKYTLQGLQEGVNNQSASQAAVAQVMTSTKKEVRFP
jgi:hypothetical protein